LKGSEKYNASKAELSGGKGKLPCSWGNKYKNLALQVGGVSKIETIKYAHESSGTETGERLRW
jgi:hypothetical protein